MQKNEQATDEVYSIMPLELKMTTGQKQILDLAFEQHARLISFLQFHYHRHYAALAARKFKFDKQEYDNLIIPFAEQAGITLHREVIRCNVDKVLETIKSALCRCCDWTVHQIHQL